MPFIRDAGLDMTAVRALGELCSYSAVEAGKEVFAQAYICHAGSCAYHVHTVCMPCICHAHGAKGMCHQIYTPLCGAAEVLTSRRVAHGTGVCGFTSVHG